MDPAVPVVQKCPDFLGNLVHPLSHCNLALLWGLGVHPVLANLEVLKFLEIPVTQEALLFLLIPLVLEVHHFPSLLWVQSGPQVQGTLALLAVLSDPENPSHPFLLLLHCSHIWIPHIHDKPQSRIPAPRRTGRRRAAPRRAVAGCSSLYSSWGDIKQGSACVNTDKLLGCLFA